MVFPYGVSLIMSLIMSLWSVPDCVLEEFPYGVSLTVSLKSVLDNVLEEDNWLTSIHITILANRDPNPRPYLYTLLRVHIKDSQ